jgi:alpha/beta superfamily hydrolase
VLLLSPEPGEGSMDVAALAELAFALSRAGHPTLRFNYGGVGASQAGSIRSAAGPFTERVDDAAAATDLLLETVEHSSGIQEIALVGFKGGCRIALALYGKSRKSLGAVVLISPPIDLDLRPVEKMERPALFVIGADAPNRAQLGQHCAGTGDRLELIERADASFNRGLPQLGAAVAGFLGST